MAKKDKKERTRDFNIDDAAVLQLSKLLKNMFLDDLAAFTAFDSELNAAFATDWQAKIDEAEAFLPDETKKDQIYTKTTELNRAKQEGFRAANDLEYYVKKAFGNDKSIRQEFGFTERTQARAAQYNLHMWLVVMKKVADDYLSELTDAGMPPTILSNLEAKTTNILTKETAQEYQKRLRVRELRKRIKSLNEVYAFCTQVNDAAQSVFRDNEAMRGKYKIYG